MIDRHQETDTPIALSSVEGRHDQGPPRNTRHARLQFAALIAGAMAAIVGATVLGAWILGFMASRGINSITMKTNTSLCLLLAGLALVLLAAERTGQVRRRLGRFCATAALLVGALTLSEHLGGWDLGIDQLLANEPPGAMGILSPNRMGPPASLSFVLAGLALLMLSQPGKRTRLPAQWLALGVCLIASFGTIGYFYDVHELFAQAGYTAIAWPTAVALLVLGVGLLCARPDQGLMALVTADDPGGMLIRSLLLPAIVLIVLLGWLRLHGEQLGLYETALGTALMVLSFLVVFCGLIYYSGARLSRMFTAERAAEAALVSVAQFPAENPHPVLRIGREGKVLYANKAAKELLLREGWAGEDPAPAELREPAAASLAAGSPHEFELICRERRVMVFLCVPVPDKAYVNLYGRDVTERRQAEEELLESRRQLALALKAGQSGAFYWDAGSNTNRWSDELLALYGLRREEFGGRYEDWIACLVPEDREAGAAAVKRSLETGEFVCEFRIRRQDNGEIRWMHGRGQVFFDEAGRPAHMVGINVDITERKRAEEDLRASELFHRQTLESIPGMVFTTRPDGYCDYQSQQWVDYTGVPMSDHVGAGWNKLLHPDDQARAYAAWQAAVEGHANYDLEYRVRRHDGRYEWFKVIGRPIRDSAGEIVRWFGVALNVEDLKRVENELKAARDSAERAKAVAEQANRAKDHFLAVLSHELRTPLTPVVMALSMLQDRPDLDPNVREMLEMIRRNVEMEARLIDDLLDVTRIARGKIELNRSPVELCTVIHRAVEVCRPDIEARGLHFGVDLGPAAPYWVEADVPRLQQVFWNLLKNAIKFTPHGGCVGIRCRPEGRVQGSGFGVQAPEVSDSLNSEPRTPNASVLIEVNDSGIGIEPEALERVFNAFEQAERSITRQFGGLGLGLAISKALVEMHGGTIEARSDGRDTGATFRIRLPLVAPAGRPVIPIPAAAEKCVAAPLRILLVEDHGVTAKMMQMVLTEEGHEVETAGDVATGLELAGQCRFDLLISDLGLPDASGHDLMRQLRGRGHRFPGIAMSGYGQEADIQRSREAGFASHLTKPASREQLIRAIASATGEQMKCGGGY